MGKGHGAKGMENGDRNKENGRTPLTGFVL